MQSKNYISALSDWLACAIDETKPLVKSVFKKTLGPGPWSAPLPVYQDLSMCHDWPVKKASADSPIRLKGNLRHTSEN